MTDSETQAVSKYMSKNVYRFPMAFCDNTVTVILICEGVSKRI